MLPSLYTEVKHKILVHLPCTRTGWACPEGEYKSRRRLLQEKLIKFASLIPGSHTGVYVPDVLSGCSLKDVITKVLPGWGQKLLKKVTALK